MTSVDSKVDALSEKVAAIALEQTTQSNSSQSSDYYATRDVTKKINFARLEKGLLLFIYVHETTKATLRSEMALWDHRLCVQMIKDGSCSKPRDQCRHEHDTTYRHPKICPVWYTRSCTFGEKCRYSHDFLSISAYHHLILNGTDWIVCKLIRFVRNFAGHYVDSAIRDENDLQELHKEILVLMVHLIHTLSLKRAKSIDHLNLFLEATTMKQMIPQDALLKELQRPYDVPEIFLDTIVNFNTHWYRHGTKKRSVDFSQMSAECVTYFNGVLVGFYEGRLKSRGAPRAWS